MSCKTAADDSLADNVFLFFFLFLFEKIRLDILWILVLSVKQMTHIRFQALFSLKNNKLEMCPQYTDAPAVGYLTIKLQNSTWYKCLNLSLTGSRTLRTYTHSYRRTYIHTHVCTYEKPKTYMPPASSDAGA